MSFQPQLLSDKSLDEHAESDPFVVGPKNPTIIGCRSTRRVTPHRQLHASPELRLQLHFWERNQTIDAAKGELAELIVWQESVQYKLIRLAFLKDAAKSWYPGLAASDQTTEVIGDYELQIGVRTFEKSWVSMAKVYEAVGSLSKFKSLCTVTFKSLSAALGAEKAAALQVETQTGSRRIKAFLKVVPAKLAA
jgi:hypothetical protein